MFELPDLPYAHGALEPFISTDTMSLHHGQHHKKYVKAANAWVDRLQKDPVQPVDLSALTAEEVVEKHFDAFQPDGKWVFQPDFVFNLGQHLNHLVFWQSMTPKRDTKPSEAFQKAISEAWSSMEDLRDGFIRAGLEQSAPGWVWLAIVPGKGLALVTTTLGWHPTFNGIFPVIGCDLWEHAYYLDYQNRKQEYLLAFWNLINWENASARFESRREIPAVSASDDDIFTSEAQRRLGLSSDRGSLSYHL